MKDLKAKLPYTFLIAYALALPLIQLQLPEDLSGFPGIFLIVAASLLGLKSGLVSAAYSIAVLIIMERNEISSTALFLGILTYLTIAVGIGFAVEEYRRTNKALEKDIAERRQVEEKLRYISYHDCLTGLYNRDFYDEQLKMLDNEKNLPLSIIMGDVNGLKLINDTFGHHAGDRLILKAAEILKAYCRPQDILCRWGGDEFMIFQPNTEKNEALEICEKILERCRKEQEAIAISISLGVATKEKPLTNIQDVIKEAEDRMYRSKLLESVNTRYTLVSSLQCLLEEKTEETIGHAQRMRKYALAIGNELKLSKKELDALALLTSLHDIGKIAIPDNIVMKLDILSPEEWEIMKKHSEIGYRIAASAPEISHIAEEILHHHERYDGTGYPAGLKGEEIPLLSRILAIADSYDVMTHGRPYKKALTQAQAAAELKRCSGTHFDPKLVEIFLRVMNLPDEETEFVL